MARVREVVLSRDAYLVCMQHVHTTDGEEVMGLLVGRYVTEECNGPAAESRREQVVCNVSHAVILRRSDKRKDRVEISPEMLIQAQQKAEEISKSSSSSASVHIVGWYHSHPKITVAPSVVDLRTQFGYQQMDDRFVGIIFSVFNRTETKVGEAVVGGFQALHQGRESYDRINVPVLIDGGHGGIAPHNQEAVCSVSNILQQEQLAVLQQSRDLHAGVSPLHHLYNAAVAVQKVSELCEQLAGPLSALVHARTVQTQNSNDSLDATIHHLTKLLKDSATSNISLDQWPIVQTSTP